MRIISIESRTKRYIPPKTRFAVFRRDGFRCQYCGRGAEEGILLEIDHIIAISNGGDSDIGNLITACVTCNHGKSTKDVLRDGSSNQPNENNTSTKSSKQTKTQMRIKDVLNSLQNDLDMLYRDRRREAGMFLFSWGDIPGQGDKKLIDFLYRTYCPTQTRFRGLIIDEDWKKKYSELMSLEWLKTAKIEKIDNGNTIRIHSGNKYILLCLDDSKTVVSLKWDSSMIIEVTDAETLKWKEELSLDELDDFREYRCSDCQKKSKCPIKKRGDSNKCENFEWHRTHAWIRFDEEYLFDAKIENNRLNIFGGQTDPQGFTWSTSRRNESIKEIRDKAEELASLIELQKTNGE